MQKQKLYTLINSKPEIYMPWVNRRVVPDWIDQEIITNRISERVFLTPQENANIDRYLLLQKNPTAWYLDADVIVRKWPDFEMEEGFPYLPWNGFNYDNWAIFGNGCVWFFDRILDFYEQHKNNPKRIWIQTSLFMELKEKIKPIPSLSSYFVHFAFNKKCLCTNLWSYEKILRKYLLNKPKRILEWGPGRSTSIMRKMLPDAEIITCEHNSIYYKRIANSAKLTVLLMEVNARYNSQIGCEYTDIWEKYVHPKVEGKFDLIFVDGRQRVECMKFALNVLSDDGFLILHDAERERYKAGIDLFEVVEKDTNTICLKKRSM